MKRLPPFVFRPVTLFFLLVLIALVIITLRHGKHVFRPKPVASLPNAQGEAAMNYLKEQGLYASLGDAMQHARYGVNAVTNAPAFVGKGEVWQAANPAQRFNAFFTATGIHLASSDYASANGWHVGIHPRGIGYGAELLPIAAGEVKTAGDRIEIHRSLSGANDSSKSESAISNSDSRTSNIELLEWYENRADGLEQGFTLNAPPGSRAATSDTRLRLVMKVSGMLQAKAASDHRALLFGNEQGDADLGYTGLTVKDALGRNLPAQLLSEADEATMEIDDSEAVYPITIDPTFRQRAKLVAADGRANAWFGNAVAISNDTVVAGAKFDDIGANFGQGSVYVFVRNGTGWSQQAHLLAPDGATFDTFGESVGVSGDTLIVGAPKDDIGTNTDQGSAYIFARIGGNWTLQSKLTAFDGAAADTFGKAVAITGDTVAIGSPFDDIVGNQDRGSTYLYIRNGTNWTLQTKIQAADGSEGDQFGAATAFSGDTLVISAPYKNNGGIPLQGAAYIWVQAGGIWTQQAKLLAPDGAANDRFGNVVAISGDTAVIGGYYVNAAYVFVRNGTTWSYQARLMATNGEITDEFGISAAINGDTIVVGADGADSLQGAAYVFRRNGTTWTQQIKLTADEYDGVGAPLFGFSVAISSDTIVIGSYQDDIGTHEDQGSAYLFSVCDNEVWTQQNFLSANDGAADDFFGYSVAISRNTVVIGAPGDDIGASESQGSAYVFISTGSGWNLQTKLTVPGQTEGSQFGWAVAINGDTIVVGAMSDTFGGIVGRGAAYVFVRNGTNWAQQARLSAADAADNDRLGWSVAISGETIIAGAPFDAIGANEQQGSAYLFVRQNTFWTQQAKVIASDGGSFDNFGWSASISQNTAVVGAPHHAIAGQSNQGAAYVFVRTEDTWDQQASLTASDGAANDFFGASVTIDENTVAVGAADDEVNFNLFQGSVYIFVRVGNSWSQQAKLIASDGVSGDHFGTAVSLSKDTLLIGSPDSDIGPRQGQGAVYSFVRIGSTWSQQAKLVSSIGDELDSLGWSVAFSNEIVVAGASADDVGANTNQGSAYTFLRNCCPLISIEPTQLPTAVQDSAYSQTLTASGGVSPYLFIVTGGSLAPGLTLSPSGLLSGTPSTTGSFSFTITATDVNGCVGIRAYMLTVNSSGFTWIGAVSSDWYTPSNWANNTVPNASSNVVIPATGVVNEPQAHSGNITIASLTLAENHGFLCDTPSLNITGNASIHGLLYITGSFAAGGAFDNTNGAVVFYGSTPQVVPSLIFDTLIINNEAGVSLGGNVTVNFILTLATDLSTGAFTLTMPAAAISEGNGDCIGNVRRTGFTPGGAALSFGNPFTTLQFKTGTMPTDVTVNLVKSAPAGYPNAVRRTYTVTPNGGSGYIATLRLHYEDAELNGNAENNLQLWRHNGSTWQSQGATANDTTDNWVETSGVTQFSPWTIGEPSGPTAVELLSFNASLYDNGALLEWQTGFETSNLGFRLWRDEGGRRLLVTPQLIAGSALTTGAKTVLQSGCAYAWWDNAASRYSTYWLEDLDLQGFSTWHGPFAVRFLGGVSPARANATLLSNLGKASSDASSQPLEQTATPVRATAIQSQVQKLLASQPAVKIVIKHEGMYRLTAAELFAAGLPHNAEARLLQLFADGEEIPILVSAGKGGRFDDSSIVEFYGYGLDTPTTDAHIYWLIQGKQAGLRIALVPSDAPPTLATSFRQTRERRERRLYFAALLNGERENFFGSVVAAPPVDEPFTLRHLVADPGSPAIAEVALQGVTLQAHRVRVELNGVALGEAIFSNQENHTARFPVPNNLLREGNNTFRLSSQNGASDVSLVDTFRITYQHTFIADSDSLKCTVSGRERITLKGFTSPRIRVFDITDKNAVQELSGKIDVEDNGYAVSVAPPVTGERVLLALTEAQLASAAAFNANRPSNWKEAIGADFIMISNGEFAVAMEPLRAQRQKEGYRVAVVDVEDLYDEFSFGNKSPQAIKDFLDFATKNWKIAPRFVLLVGDASYDARNYLGAGDFDFVPTKLLDSNYLETASDDWFADFDEDGLAEVSLGRLPVRSAEETVTIVNKLLRHAQAKSSLSALLVADANDRFDFEQVSHDLRPLLPADWRVDELRRGQLDATEAKAQLLAALTRGQRIINYLGHGSVNLWHGNLLTSTDAETLTNETLPVFVMMDCLNGYFLEPVNESLGEALFKSERGGAIAVWASSSLTIPQDQQAINQEFYRQLLNTNSRGARVTLGEAVRRAKAVSHQGDIRRTWILFGDPTLQWK